MKMKDFDLTMTHYNRGDIITGTIVMIGQKEVTVAIGGLREGVFPREELDPAFKLGDAILVMVTGEIDEKGCLVMNMADFEVCYDCIDRTDKICVDYWESIKHRMISTVALMWKDGLVKDEDIHAELGEILNGTKAARENDDEIIYFNAVGAGIMDIAVTARCYHTALETGKGIKLPFWE